MLLSLTLSYPDGEKKLTIIIQFLSNSLSPLKIGFTCSYSPWDAQWNQYFVLSLFTFFKNSLIFLKRFFRPFNPLLILSLNGYKKHKIKNKIGRKIKL